MARFQVGRERLDVSSLRPLIDAHTRDLTLPHTDDALDPERETKWLAHVEGLELTSEEVTVLRDYLVGTLPVAAYGPPHAMSTRQRDETAMADFKRTWTIALRWVLLGGGGLFLTAMTVAMVRSHAAAADKALAELDCSGALGDERMQDAIASARRIGLLRGLGLVAIMAAGLVLAVLMLEAMTWEF